ncbi:MAG: hypothetical protein ACRC8R_11960 [Aeromonas hydrophila]
MTNLTKAQAKAAQLCLDILTKAGLIGDELITKLPAAREAILEALPKAYSSIREVEEDAGVNLDTVRNSVCQMYGRNKWADHDAMMDTVEGLLNGFVADGYKVASPVSVEVTEPATTTPAKPSACPTFGAECRGCPDCSAVMGDATYQEMEQGLKEEVELIEEVGDTTMETTQPEPEIDMGMDTPSTKPAPTPGNDEPVYLEPSEEVINTAKESVKGLKVRIENLEKALENGGQSMKEFIIVSQLGSVGYELIRGEWKATADLINMTGFETMEMALEACPAWLCAQGRGVAIADNLHHSKAALEQLTEHLASQGIEA